MGTIDLSRFQATFFAESREGLDAMEAGLLALESGGADGETINTIFRAAHSIKGGSATFGFKAIAETTHLLETLLDRIRSGKRSVDEASSDALLASVDVLRGMLDRAEEGVPDTHGDAALDARLKALLEDAPVVAEQPKVDPAKEIFARWQIRFAPKPGLFLSGNDPLRIARELASLGTLRTTCDMSALPAFADLDPTQAYLAWDFELDANVARGKIADVFSWVEDECDLQIRGIADPVPIATTSAAPAAIE
ncbi:MAG TPA: Hpt domain-containing protein, partial [Rudaea sp.]